MSMPLIKFTPIKEVTVLPNRFRRVFSETNLSGLQESISTGIGLSNAVVLRKDGTLISGATRLKAITLLHELGLPVKYLGEDVPLDTVPTVYLANAQEEIEYLEAELSENTRREGFTYLEEADAIAKIALLQQAILNEKAGKSSSETLGLHNVSKEAIINASHKVFEGKAGVFRTDLVRDSLTLINAVNSNEKLGVKLIEAKNISEGRKILKRHVIENKRALLAREQGTTLLKDKFEVILGDCVEELTKLETNTFDVCLTDPIYGINSHEFGDSGGSHKGTDHKYNDTLENFKEILPKALVEVSRVLKSAAHLYLTCDIRNYYLLKEMVLASSIPGNSWSVPNAPIIMYKTTSFGRVPHPGFTFARSYEICLYAYRGAKQEYKLYTDVLPCASSDKKGSFHGAGKPQEFLKKLLTRSCLPGDKVLDFMVGSGSIFQACNELKLYCTGIELDPKYYGECLERIKTL